MPPLSTKLLHILQHSLGCDKHGQTSYRGTDEGDGTWWYHRNHFVTDPEGPDGKLCQELVALGFMADLGPHTLAGGDHCFRVTEAGRDAMINQSPKAPRLSKSAERYRYFRASADAFWPAKFGDWLTKPCFAESRARSGLF